MRLHLLSHRQMRQDGTYTIEEIERPEFAGLLQWAASQGIIQNHVYTRTIAKHIDSNLRIIPKYQRDYTLQNNDLLLIVEKGKYYKGTFIDQCPNNL